ncbi:hypothetical protein J6590_022970 [Homalodisca vitripennis]|nr:hypothetical protein J6590_022970 [Homalodisca vitripennis]
MCTRIVTVPTRLLHPARSQGQWKESELSLVQHQRQTEGGLCRLSVVRRGGLRPSRDVTEHMHRPLHAVRHYNVRYDHFYVLRLAEADWSLQPAPLRSRSRSVSAGKKVTGASLLAAAYLDKPCYMMCGCPLLDLLHRPKITNYTHHL